MGDGSTSAGAVSTRADFDTQSMNPLTLSFWLQFLFLTLVNRRTTAATALVEDHIGKCQIHGAEHIPTTGPFVLAANHYLRDTLVRVVGALLCGLREARPGAVDEIVIIASKSLRKNKQGLIKRTLRRFMDTIYWLWRRNVLVVPMGDTASVAAMLEWRRRAATQPVLVFPEGRSSKTFTAVKKNAGRWLRTLGTPVIPVGVWHQDGVWHVRFGPPVKWTGASANSDSQLSQVIAGLLPPELAPTWYDES